jgi:hypothetical protein
MNLISAKVIIFSKLLQKNTASDNELAVSVFCGASALQILNKERHSRRSPAWFFTISAESGNIFLKLQLLLLAKF